MPDKGYPLTWRTRMLAVLAGMGLTLAFAPINWYPFAYISPALLFWLWRNASPRQAAQLGFLFGLGQFGLGVSWVYVAIHDVGQSPIWLATLLTLIFITALACYPALAGWLSLYLKKKSPPLLWVIGILPAVWVLVEWLRGWLFSGFTWLQLGYSQIDLPLASLAPWLGVYGVSWAVALSAALLLLIVTKTASLRIGAMLGLLALWGVAILAGQVSWSEPVGKPLKVSLIQGNAPQMTKWDPAKLQFRLDLYARLTREHWDSDLIIWPENSLTTFYHTLDETYLTPLAKEARQHNSVLVVGVPVMDLETNRYYTTLTVLGEKPQSYRKRHLVPFGEFIPLQFILRGLVGFFDLPMSAFSPGEAEQPQFIAAGQPLAPTVCYEDAFGEEVIDFLPEATLLVNGSNNAWYGDSFAPHQHLQISRMRSLETSRPLLRVTTNGISAFVDHRGKIISRSPQFETFVLSDVIQPRKGATLYVLSGNYPIVILLFALLLVIPLYGERKRGKVKNGDDRTIRADVTPAATRAEP